MQKAKSTTKEENAKKKKKEHAKRSNKAWVAERVIESVSAYKPQLTPYLVERLKASC